MECPRMDPLVLVLLNLVSLRFLCYCTPQLENANQIAVLGDCRFLCLLHFNRTSWSFLHRWEYPTFCWLITNLAFPSLTVH